MRIENSKRSFVDAALMCCAVWFLLFASVSRAENLASREEGQFSIYVAGKEIGKEKFLIQAAGETVTSTSTLNFRDPGDKRREVKIETELSMDKRLMPHGYKVRTEMEGRKQAMRAAFTDGQARYEYDAGGGIRKEVLLVGDGCSILDTNVFHHFIFIARLFDLGSIVNQQEFRVVIPQEMETGVLKIGNMGIEKVPVRGKERELHHLRADSGSAKIDLWMDDQRILHKIALPSKGIDVVRN